MSLSNLLVFLVVLGVFVPAVATIGCLNHQGELVDWFVIISSPKKIRQYVLPEYGYQYMDSNFKNYTFLPKRGFGNEQNTPVHRTISQGNKTNLLSVVWNDQLEKEQGSGDSDDAHSKSYIVMDEESNQGFFMDHSVPKYPFIDDEGKIRPHINDDQRSKAQHHFCISLNRMELAEKLFEHACFIKANIYHNTLFSECKKISGNDIMIKFYDFKVGKFNIKSIFKNGHRQIVNNKKTTPLNGSIFEYGVTKSIESSIIVQTYYGAKEPDCEGEYHIGRVNSIHITKDISWGSTSDHCKWVFALDNDYSCFGDLNRNHIKQLIRGGAFYCVDSPYLNAALKKLAPNADKC